MWDREALDLIVPAHLTLGRDGLGEMQLIAIGAQVDYRVVERDGATIVEFSWSGFDEMDPTSGRGWARIARAVVHSRGGRVRLRGETRTRTSGSVGVQQPQRARTSAGVVRDRRPPNRRTQPARKRHARG